MNNKKISNLNFFETLTYQTLTKTNIEIIAKSIVNGFISGYHKSPFFGFSTTFKEHREYVYGDPIKYIDWKKYAHIQKLMIKKYEQETNMRVLFVVDISSSMNYPLMNKYPYSKKVFALICVAVLTYFLRLQNDSYGILFFGDKIIDYIAPSRGPIHNKNFFSLINKHVAKETEGIKTSLVEPIKYGCFSLPKRSTIIVFSDFIQESLDISELRNVVLLFNSRMHYPIFFHVIDMLREVELTQISSPVFLRDVETLNKIEISHLSILESYQEQMKKILNEVSLLFKSVGGEYILADINNTPDLILNTFYLFRKRWIGKYQHKFSLIK